MAASGGFKITEPENIKMTLTITMSVKEWRGVRAELSPMKDAGQWQLSDQIAQLVDKANKEFRFYEETERDSNLP
jgi:hypothetical protein